MSNAIAPFILSIPQTEIDDLYRRLDHTCWPDRETKQWRSDGTFEYLQARILAIADEK